MDTRRRGPRERGHRGLTPVSEATAAVDAAAIEQFHQEGWAILPAVLPAPEVVRARAALVVAAEASEARGMPTRLEALDPGGRNIRVYDLPEHDPLFLILLTHPVVLAHASLLLDGDLAISNFTANIALPGSRSMRPHNDQSTLMPEPWTSCWSLNAIWCLDDIDGSNGATRYLPGSHRFTCFAEVPDDPTDGMVPFEAAAGDVVLMDGRLWHTSGANTTRDRERALLFALYTRSFLRHQNNWGRSLSRETKRALDPQVKEWLGLGNGNMGYGTYLAGG